MNVYDAQAEMTTLFLHFSSCLPSEKRQKWRMAVFYRQPRHFQRVSFVEDQKPPTTVAEIVLNWEKSEGCSVSSSASCPEGKLPYGQGSNFVISGLSLCEDFSIRLIYLANKTLRGDTAEQSQVLVCHEVIDADCHN